MALKIKSLHDKKSILISLTLTAAFFLWAGAACASSCITTDLLNPDGTHTKTLPLGCTFNGSAPFTFTSVSDANNVTHNVTINSFEQFASLSGVGGVFISGIIDSTPFSGIGEEVHPADTMGNIILPVPTTNYPVTLTSELISPVTLPSNFMMRLDPNMTSNGYYSVATYGAPINGVQNYQVTDNFSLFFQASLNNGNTWISNDPVFSLSTFDLSKADPQIQRYIASVPVPGGWLLMLSGLGLIGFMAICRGNSGGIRHLDTKVLALTH